MNKYDINSQELAYDEDYYDYSEEILAIQQEYRRKRLLETLIGPLVSTVFHVLLIIILAMMITDTYKKVAPDIVVEIEKIEEVEIEEPPPIEEPEPQELEPTDVSDPVLTTVQLENV